MFFVQNTFLTLNTKWSISFSNGLIFIYSSYLSDSILCRSMTKVMLLPERILSDTVRYMIDRLITL